jgi:hypothetical protein
MNEGVASALVTPSCFLGMSGATSGATFVSRMVPSGRMESRIPRSRVSMSTFAEGRPHVSGHIRRGTEGLPRPKRGRRRVAVTNVEGRALPTRAEKPSRTVITNRESRTQSGPQGCPNFARGTRRAAKGVSRFRFPHLYRASQISRVPFVATSTSGDVPGAGGVSSL